MKEEKQTTKKTWKAPKVSYLSSDDTESGMTFPTTEGMVTMSTGDFVPAAS
ncbi:MAG: hypothetical protein ACJAWV_001634 [Flammeovirgaceae bacterium]|jgi:hypothetical protein